MELNYGTITFPLGLSPDKVMATVQAAPPPTEENPRDIIGAALDACRSRLKSFRPGERVVIVTSDITRYTGS
ncbi:MAG TPA: lactate racemase domain-containing protein, partial [Geobacteraceae bacterium]|nr:lactate racemase domain-containing protein [Geobacteraceae bacterium]